MTDKILPFTPKPVVAPPTEPVVDPTVKLRISELVEAQDNIEAIVSVFVTTEGTMAITCSDLGEVALMGLLAWAQHAVPNLFESFDDTDTPESK